MEDKGKTVFQNLNAMLGLEEQKTCPHRNAQVVYDHQLRMIHKCYDCGEETLLAQPTNAICSVNNNVAIGHCSTSIGQHSKAFGCANIAIGASAGYSTGTTYSGDYSSPYTTRSLTDKTTDMRFSDALRKDLDDYRTKLNKAQNEQQTKLERLKAKVNQYKNGITREKSNEIQSEIDRIRAKYDETLNKYQNNDFVSQSIREAGGLVGGLGKTILQSPPPPPPFPQKRKVGAYDPSSNKGYYKEEPQKPLEEYTDIEYVQFMIRDTTFEEKTYEDVKYLDFIFHTALDQNDSRLNILESGDVLEWKKVPKNLKLGILSPKIKMIKSIRISVEDLKNSRKPQTDEN